MLVHWQCPFLWFSVELVKSVNNIIVTVTLDLIQKSFNFSISLFILMLILLSYVSFFINLVSVLCLWGVSPVGDQSLRCSHQHSNFSWIGDQWVIISSLEMHFLAKWCLRNKCRNSIQMSRHYIHLGSDKSSVWNFCTSFLDTIL